MENFSRILKEFGKKRVVVIGDVMLDKYIYGDVTRISPEAPVPVVKVEKEIYNLGGAANVAVNVASLDGKAVLFGFVGKDKEAEIVRNLLKERNIDFYLDENSRTTLKARIIVRNQQAMRLDYEDVSKNFFSIDTGEKLIQETENSDIILVSDYAKGTVTEELMDCLSDYKGKVIVDPKPQNLSLYKKVFLLTPNEEEAEKMSYKKDIKEAGEFLKKKLLSNILITRGEKGMMLFPNNSDKILEIPTYAKEVYDVTGAGDSVVACLALALASNASLEEAAILANHAAGIVVGKAGTYQVKLNELESKILGEESKVKNLGELEEIVSDLKRKGKKAVWTNGCFDLLHEGHVKYLKKAKEEGDYLIIGINSDSSIKKLKGEGRPVRPEKARAEIISALEFVDYVIIFPEISPIKYLSLLKPEVYVKGGDYTIETINQEERKLVESYRGKIKIIPLIEAISTTEILEKIKGNNSKLGKPLKS